MTRTKLVELGRLDIKIFLGLNFSISSMCSFGDVLWRSCGKRMKQIQNTCVFILALPFISWIYVQKETPYSSHPPCQDPSYS